MKLKCAWKDTVWENASIEALVAEQLNRSDCDGQLETLQGKLTELSSMFVRLLERAQLSDQEILEIIGANFSWKLVK